jgi:hypothetical protein
MVAGIGHPGGQVAPAGDHVGGTRHPVQRRQAAADQPPAAQPEQREQDRPRDELSQNQDALISRRAVWARHHQDILAGRQQALLAADPDVDPPPDRGQGRLARLGDREQRLGRILQEIRCCLPGDEQVVQQILQFGGGVRRPGQDSGRPRGHADVGRRVAVLQVRDLGQALLDRKPEVGIELILLDMAQDHRGDHAHDDEE